MVRAFLSFDVEDEGILDRIAEAQRRLAPSGARLKFVERENFHICIKFLGQITPKMVELISKGMDELTFPGFKIELKGLGAFPKLTYPRVVWVGVKEGAEELTSIFNVIEPKLVKFGIRPETRPFHPHATVARVKGGGRGKLVDIIKAFSDYEFGIIEGECLRLKQSTLTMKGPVYRTLHEVNATEG